MNKQNIIEEGTRKAGEKQDEEDERINRKQQINERIKEMEMREATKSFGLEMKMIVERKSF